MKLALFFQVYLQQPHDTAFATPLLKSQQTVCPLQVHKAKLKYSGTIVAVKVQYPDSLNVMLQVSF